GVPDGVLVGADIFAGHARKRFQPGNDGELLLDLHRRVARYGMRHGGRQGTLRRPGPATRPYPPDEICDLVITRIEHHHEVVVADLLTCRKAGGTARPRTPICQNPPPPPPRPPLQ